MASQIVKYKTLTIRDPVIINQENNTRFYEREYAVIEPQNLEKPVGILLFFHGWTSNYNNTQQTGYNENVDKYNYLMVYPNGMASVQKKVNPRFSTISKVVRT